MGRMNTRIIIWLWNGIISIAFWKTDWTRFTRKWNSLRKWILIPFNRFWRVIVQTSLLSMHSLTPSLSKLSTEVPMSTTSLPWPITIHSKELCASSQCRWLPLVLVAYALLSSLFADQYDQLQANSSTRAGESITLDRFDRRRLCGRHGQRRPWIASNPQEIWWKRKTNGSWQSFDDLIDRWNGSTSRQNGTNCLFDLRWCYVASWKSQCCLFVAQKQ